MADQKEETIEAKVDANYKKYGILHGPEPKFHYYLTPPQRLIDIYYTFALTKNERQIDRLAGDKIIQEKDWKRIADGVGVSKEYVRRRGWHETHSIHEKASEYEELVWYITHVISCFNLDISGKNHDELRSKLNEYMDNRDFPEWKRKLKKLREASEKYEGELVRHYDGLLRYIDDDKDGFKIAMKGSLDKELIELAKKFKGSSLDRAYIMKEFIESVPTDSIAKDFLSVLRQMDAYVKAKELIGRYKIQEKT